MREEMLPSLILGSYKERARLRGRDSTDMWNGPSGPSAESRTRSVNTSSRSPILAVFFVVLAASTAHAVQLWKSDDGTRAVSLDTGLKCTALLSRAPEDPVLYPEREYGIGLFRARMSLNAKFSEAVNGEVAYEQRVRISSDDAGSGAGILPTEAPAPYRADQLDWEISETEDDFSYRHEIDRALLALHPKWGNVTIGRQAIGLGRGVIFGAADVFAPFSPLEVDREWRRGVDALRAEYRTTDTTSIELIGVAGEDWDNSAVLARGRGIFGKIDGEIILGKRAMDGMLAGIVSGTVKNAEVHAELALFNLPDSHPAGGGVFGDDKLVSKIVAGASYTFDVGEGLSFLAEYHYSGLGMEHIEDATILLADPDYLVRYLRGDTQLLGRHALAVQASYPLSEIWNGSLLVLVSLSDGSGLVTPSLTWDFAENVSFSLSGFIPWGDEPTNGTLESEYGGSPLSLFVQLSIYH